MQPKSKKLTALSTAGFKRPTSKGVEEGRVRRGEGRGRKGGREGEGREGEGREGSGREEICRTNVKLLYAPVLKVLSKYKVK